MNALTSEHQDTKVDVLYQSASDQLLTSAVKGGEIEKKLTVAMH
jgi:hypothetical protein